tara:strand:+ start:406 stop:936 length:531 start_codon:yes stop_codon:yes gene_type:complete
MTSTIKVDNIAHSGGTTGMTINSDGRVLTPARPAFSVTRYGASGGTGLSGHITFDTVTFNIGSCWDGTNKFQAPVAGIYFFSLTAFTSNGNAVQADNSDIKLYIEQDTDSSFGSPTTLASGYTYLNGTTGYFNVSISGAASLAANEYVRVNCASGNIYTSTEASNYPPKFTGFLIG